MDNVVEICVLLHTSFFSLSIVGCSPSARVKMHGYNSKYSQSNFYCGVDSFSLMRGAELEFEYFLNI